jgi:hypothetical protein
MPNLLAISEAAREQFLKEGGVSYCVELLARTKDLDLVHNKHNRQVFVLALACLVNVSFAGGPFIEEMATQHALSVFKDILLSMLPQLVKLRRKREQERESVEEEKVERTDEEVLTDLCMVLRNLAAHAPKLVLESDLLRPIIGFLEQIATLQQRGSSLATKQDRALELLLAEVFAFLSNMTAYSEDSRPLLTPPARHAIIQHLTDPVPQVRRFAVAILLNYYGYVKQMGLAEFIPEGEIDEAIPKLLDAMSSALLASDHKSTLWTGQVLDHLVSTTKGGDAFVDRAESSPALRFYVEDIITRLVVSHREEQQLLALDLLQAIDAHASKNHPHVHGAVVRSLRLVRDSKFPAVRKRAKEVAVVNT